MSSTDHYARIVPLHKARNRNNDISRPEDEQFNANRNSIDKVLESATQHVFAQVVDYLKQQESKTTLESDRVRCLFLQGQSANWDLIKRVCRKECSNVHFDVISSKAPSMETMQLRIRNAVEANKQLALVVENIETLSDANFIEDTLDICNEENATQNVILLLTSMGDADINYANLVRSSLVRLDIVTMKLPSSATILRRVLEELFGLEGENDEGTGIFFSGRLLRYICDRYLLQNQSIDALRSALVFALRNFWDANRFEKLQEHEHMVENFQVYKDLLGVFCWLNEVRSDNRPELGKVLGVHCSIQEDEGYVKRCFDEEITKSLRSADVDRLDEILERTSTALENHSEYKETQHQIKQLQNELQLARKESASNNAVKLLKKKSATDLLKDRQNRPNSHPSKEKATKFLAHFFSHELQQLNRHPLLVDCPDLTLLSEPNPDEQFERIKSNKDTSGTTISYALTSLIDQVRDSDKVKIARWYEAFESLSGIANEEECRAKFFMAAGHLEYAGIIRTVSTEVIQLLHFGSDANDYERMEED